jgi:hypothetical protein
LNHTPAGEVHAKQFVGRVAEIETLHRQTANLTHNQRAGHSFTQRQRFFNPTHEYDLTGASRKSVRGGRKSPAHVNGHHGVRGRATGFQGREFYLHTL